MSTFDYVILAALAVSGVLGYVRGLVKELMSLVAYVAAGIAATWWGPEASVWLAGYLDNHLMRSAAAYAVVFIVVLLGLGLVNKAVSAVIEHTGLGPMDHGLGMLFGLLRASVFILILVTIAGYTKIPLEPWWQASSLVKIAIDAVIGIKSYVPPDLAAWLPY